VIRFLNWQHLPTIFIYLGPVIKYKLDRLRHIILLGGKTLFPFPIEEKFHGHQTLCSP
jgi:hypothetical protein